MEAIELLAKLRTGEKELGEIEQKMNMLEKEIAMIRQEIVDFCKSTENYEVVLGSAIRNGIGQTVKKAKYVSIFSSHVFNVPDFAEIVRGKRYGLFRSDSEFAPVVRFLGFDSLGYPDEYKRSRKAAKGLAEEGKTVVVFDKEICFDKMIIPFTEKREET
jgi:hypothetical protein